jgi:hypothetical protein
MSTQKFINEFIAGENEIYEYNKKDRKELKKRLNRLLNKFIYNREKRFYNHIHYLKRKNKKLEDDYESLRSIQKTNDNIDANDYYDGYKVVAVSFIRMCFVIYLSLMVVYILDNLNPKVLALPMNS